MLNTISGLLGGGAPAGGDYESIATTTLATGSSTITFSSIAGTYSHLQLRCTVLTAGATQLYLRYNSDTGSNYTEHDIIGNGSTASAYGAGNITWIPMGTVSNLANSNSVYVIDILDYANTNKFKTTRGLTGYDKNGSGEIGLYSGLWRNTAAISTINIVGSVNFSQYSSFALYGIK